MGNKNIELICDKKDSKKVYINNGIINNGYEIKGCGKKISLDFSDVPILVAREKDYWDEDILTFYWVCPECEMIHALDDRLLTYEQKLELMQSHAGIADELYQWFVYKKIKKDLSKEISEIGKLQDEFSRKINSISIDSTRDTSRLYPYWEESSLLLKRKI